jgi:hypothetical protein
MPLDHYVSQVHLKQFCNTESRQLRVVRKSDMKSFPARTQDVCRIEDGSTNSYLAHDRAIEEFLKTIEPNYDKAVQSARDGKLDADAVYVIAGFAAYVASCSPTGMRLHAKWLQKLVEQETISLERLGELPPMPPVLGASAKDAIESGMVRVEIDEKYPQAIGISQIENATAMLGNFHWEILRNRDSQNQFLTSDYPVAMESTEDPRVMNRIVPLAPDLAVRILPDLSLEQQESTLDFKRFRYRARSLSSGEVSHANRLIVRSAEDLVFSAIQADWLHRFVGKNRHFWLDMLNDRFPTERGTLLLSRQRIVQRAEREKK